MSLIKLSDYFATLRSIKDKYDWMLDGGAIRCRLKRSRATGTIEPVVAIIREFTGNNRIRRYRGHMHGAICNHTNMDCFVRSCRRPGRRGHTPRNRHARIIISKILGLTGEVA